MTPFRYVAAALILAIVSGRAIAGEGNVRKKQHGTVGSYIVILNPSMEPDVEALVMRLATRFGLKKTAVWKNAVKGFAFDAQESVALALSRLPEIGVIEEDAPAEPLWCYQTSTSSPCADRRMPWQLDRVDQPTLPLDYNYGWCEKSQGRGVRAYVIDSGIAGAHPEFRSRWDNGQRVAAGQDFVGDGRGTSDCDAHGTIVASLLAGLHTGIAKDATIVPLRVLGCPAEDNYSHTTSRTISAVNWIIADHPPGDSPAVCNMSIKFPYSYALDQAITKMVKTNGVFLATAAGNDNGADGCTTTPQANPNAMVVGASDISDNVWSGSNLGGCVGVFAPGVAVAGAGITAPYQVNCNPGWTGTSFASPLVAGAAAVYLSGITWATPGDVRTAIINGSFKDVLHMPNRPLAQWTANRLLNAHFYYGVCIEMCGQPELDPGPPVIMAAPSRP
jgi:subtilisin family serine protease